MGPHSRFLDKILHLCYIVILLFYNGRYIYIHKPCGDVNIYSQRRVKITFTKVKRIYNLDMVHFIKRGSSETSVRLVNLTML